MNDKITDTLIFAKQNIFKFLTFFLAILHGEYNFKDI